MQIIIGYLFAIAISIIAWRLRALKLSGAVAATISGGTVFAFGGVTWAVLLLIFFISSSALSKLLSSKKLEASDSFSKGGQRDWGQVFANGGLAVLLAVIHFLRPEIIWIYPAFAGAIAAVNADTWSTELGVLSPRPPRLITTWQVVERGTSGAISLSGSLAGLGGSLLIGIFACLLMWNRNGVTAYIFPVFLGVTGGGIFGSIIDSFLGATIQGIYFCTSCGKSTESYPVHHCGNPTYQIRGIHWVNNDVVNFICSFSGASFAIFLLIRLI